MSSPAVWAFRRVVVAPAVVALTALMWLTLPGWLLVAAALSPVLPGRWRALRVLWLVLLYATLETLLLAVLLGLWLASGFGWRIRSPYFAGIHYDLVQGTLIVFFREARRVLALRIRTDGPHPSRTPDGPVIVMCRHAGPGDSFMLMYALLHWYHREPRVVLKNTLAWDPAIDVILNRVPARFISPNPAAGEDLEAQIASLATGLDANDAFVIFPEGGNFTPARRDRAIARLRKLGLERMAVRAEEMVHVLAPRPGGVLAALEAAPEADVLMVAHTGLDHLLTVGDLWRELPMDKQITMRWWQVARQDIPADREERIDWLYGWWERIDAWVEEHRPA
ncbi:1-acyl-sn-glycerol-3-phosphate acyltransferase [Nocardioides eburneiflavus]|uniref:1-acyl-sn-glycerol-3-phosphate acyltransferase n=1 Tax=Nocardioides eburneiflavus TaxID=2518372 RepID=A0A4Z1CCB0_9ACTN|nr:1-acyl-sn-glycerol-3-phosphate acyltransferase [Nocardioides eburneiflavus]TGN63175.1 1-acyl-sn-glycerol-3-phosphate acyltransferase [Nocardioides eburneiflavus]